MDAQLEQQFLTCYDAVSEASGRMLDAARSSDWESMVSAERECAELISRLKRLGAPDGMSEPARRRRIETLRKIVADDAQIRELTQPWLLTLDRFIQPSGTPKSPGRQPG